MPPAAALDGRPPREGCLSHIAGQLAGCLAQARDAGDLNPDADVDQLAALFVDGWEGAALRSRLRRDEKPLQAMLNLYFTTIATR